MAKYTYSRYTVNTSYSAYLLSTRRLIDYAHYQYDLSALIKVSPLMVSNTYTLSNGVWGLGTTQNDIDIGYIRSGVYAIISGQLKRYVSTYVSGSNTHLYVDEQSYSYTTSQTRGTFLSTIVVEYGTYPSNGRHADGYWYVRGALANNVPTITDATENNKIFYESDTISINGSATDNDNGNIMSVKYKVNTGTAKAIATGISDGTTAIAYSKTLKYTNGKLLDGVTEISTGLVDGQTYSITIWAEDDQGGKSTEVVRNFTVVPNRPPVLNLDSITSQTNKINSEVITITGNVTDADGNDVTVDVKINDNASKQIYSGVPSPFTSDIKIADLKEGENTITVTSKDTFDFVTTKVIKLNKVRNATKLNKAIARYKVNPPAGSAKQILAWVQKEIGGLTVDADISMILQGESESYVSMSKLTAPINDVLEEDEFAYESLEEKDNITLKLKLSKTDANSTKSIKQISGVLK